MALIKCPECGNEISNKAAVCVYCGIPIESIEKLHREQEEEKIDLNYEYVFICPKCGNISGGKTYGKHCVMCDTVYIQTDMKRDEYQGIISKNLFTSSAYVIDEIQKQLRQRFVSNTIDELEMIKARHKQEMLKNSIIEAGTTNSSNIPRCPTCQSTDIKKISGLSKAGSVAIWGFFSQKIKKQWHCNNCGSEW